MFLYNPTEFTQSFKITTEKEPYGITVSVEPGSFFDFEEHKQYLYVLKSLAPLLEVKDSKEESVAEVKAPVAEDRMAKVRAARKK